VKVWSASGAPVRGVGRRIALGGAFLLQGSTAHAHPSAMVDATAGMWTWDPWALALLALSGGGYALGLVRLWSRAGVGHGVRGWQAACFGAGWALVAMALLGPLDRASDVYFSAHMGQHEVLMLLSAPLMALGVPHRAALFALPSTLRDRTARAWRRPLVSATTRALTAPLIVVGLQIVVISAWHVPLWFEAALRDERVHTAQHVMFLGSALLFWAAVLSGRYGRGGYGMGLLFVFLIALHGGVLGALITFATHAWYPTHAERTQTAGVDPVHDQQLAGLLMWVPGGLILLASAIALFSAWLGAMERQLRRS
jgi:putative membrane protein